MPACVCGSEGGLLHLFQCTNCTSKREAKFYGRKVLVTSGETVISSPSRSCLLATA